MHRMRGSTLAIVIVLLGSSGCARSVPGDDAAASIGSRSEPILVWAVSARECVSCQMDAHALRQILGGLKETLIVQRRQEDAPVVDGFLRRERISAEPTKVRVVRVGANGGAWVVVSNGRVIARENYSLVVKGDGLRALREVVQGSGLLPRIADGASSVPTASPVASRATTTITGGAK